MQFVRKEMVLALALVYPSISEILIQDADQNVSKIRTVIDRKHVSTINVKILVQACVVLMQNAEFKIILHCACALSAIQVILQLAVI
jgi:hypothetical protein